MEAVRCPACDELTSDLTCPSCGAERSSGVVRLTRAQAGTDRDTEAQDRDRRAELRDGGAEGRDTLAREHDQAAGDREELSSAEGQTLSDHDQAASRRDQLSADDDQRAADDDLAAGGDAAIHDRGTQARRRSGYERGFASAARSESTTARRLDGADMSRANDLVLAERDREAAADDRQEAADDRLQAALERGEALQDRTESVLAEQRAVETLESMSDAFLTLDPEWRLTYLNPQTEAFLGGRRREDVVGRTVSEAFPEILGTRFDDECRRAARDQVPVRFEEAHAALGRTLEVRAYPVTNGLAVYFTDVTDERRRDARLRQTERLETLGHLTAGVAHDFNNFLAVIGGVAYLGQTAGADDETAGYFDQIALASEKATALTRQLLAFGRGQDLAPSRVDLNEIVAGLWSLLQNLVPSSILLRLEPAPRPVHVFADRSQLEQVVVNLVVNARDAIDRGGSITITTASESPGGASDDVLFTAGWLRVTDTGAGIPNDVLPHIFDPFFSTKARDAGTGLGLATIYGIVAQSGGVVSVDSAVGVGTTMTVALPQSPPPVLSGAPSAALPPQ